MLQYIDNTETITLRKKDKTEVSFPNSLLRPFRSRQRIKIAETLFPSFVAHWYLPMTAGGLSPPLVSVDMPLVNEEIIDLNGNHWLILEVHPSPMNHNWQITARCYYVPLSIDDYFDLLRKVEAPDGESYVPVRCGIAARFSAAVIDFDNGTKTSKETVYILCRETVEADITHFVRPANGKIYAVEKIKTGVWTEMRITFSGS